MSKAARAMFNTETVVSYLPLSHVAAQLIDIFCPIIVGATVYFAQPDALKVAHLTYISARRFTDM